MNRSDLPLFVSLREIADLADVSFSAVSSWSRTYEDFPVPHQTLAIGSIYLELEVKAFLARHDNLGTSTREKLRKEQKDEIRARIAGGDARVSVIAREYDVSRALIYKFAGDLLADPEGSKEDDE